MQKISEDNQEVKASITRAFFDLIKEQPPEELSVTQIARTAGVSRMSYYRNYYETVDIVKEFLRAFFDDLQDKAGKDSPVWTATYGQIFLEHMRWHRDKILLLVENGYLEQILTSFNEAIEEIAGDMPVSSVERYRLYCAAGASFNTSLLWLQEGCKESVEDILGILYPFMVQGGNAAEERRE